MLRRLRPADGLVVGGAGLIYVGLGGGWQDAAIVCGLLMLLLGVTLIGRQV